MLAIEGLSYFPPVKRWNAGIDLGAYLVPSYPVAYWVVITLNLKPVLFNSLQLLNGKATCPALRVKMRGYRGSIFISQDK